MLSLREIRPYFPETLHRFPRFMIREYLQYKILEILYNSSFATDLCFLGGTCLRIVHGNRRFSEDLDFDNISLSENAFDSVAAHIQKELRREGYRAELKTVMKGAWHCYIRFPGLLFEEGLSGHKEEKILLQLDTEPQHFDYDPEKVILNRFDIFTTILSTPLTLLMAQKFYAIIHRKRNKGRDFYDIVFLLGKGIIPNYDYLNVKTGITNANQLKEVILSVCDKISMKEMADDVAPFLFKPKDTRKVLLFEEYKKQVKM